MDVLAFCTEDDAVSSVLGVVLMVAITIILAAIVGTFVLGIGEGLTNPTPEVVFDYSTDVNDDDSKKSSVTILHAGGDGLESERLEVTIEGETAWAGGSDSGPDADGTSTDAGQSDGLGDDTDIEALLCELDVATMTPLDALNTLADLADRVE